MNIHGLRVPKATVTFLETPEVFFTVHGNGVENPKSVAVLTAMRGLVNGDGVRCTTFSSVDELREVPLDRAVAIFDGAPRHARNQYSPILIGETKNTPMWTAGIRWGVVVNGNPRKHVNEGRCARNSLALFGKRFRTEIDLGHFPWGEGRRGTQSPSDLVTLDRELVLERLAALNNGPNLAEAIASKEFAAELPKGSRISWIRIAPAPLGYDHDKMSAVVKAMRALEEASGHLVKRDGAVRETILAGVDIRDERLRSIYTDPGVPHFSVMRPDVHWGENGVKVSENDEMPGGMPELVHIDVAYGVNRERWKAFFDWLTSRGPLVFIVSHQWSECYIPETAWLVEHLRSKGYPVHLLTTDRLRDLSVTKRGVFFGGEKVGTVWRQFPIFETVDTLADLVVSARRGDVRLVPEFAHFGNKAWFHLFTAYAKWYEHHVAPDDLALLRDILPESRFIQDSGSFPCRVGSLDLPDTSALTSLSESDRDRLVLKICGANNLAARSYGVLIGAGIRSSLWSEWVRTRLLRREPFLIQERFHTGIARIPVWNTALQKAEMFSCRLLMRPWAYTGGIVSVHGCAVPHQYHKVHGMVSMMVAPVELVDRKTAV